jgi:hypothetical protein
MIIKATLRQMGILVGLLVMVECSSPESMYIIGSQCSMFYSRSTFIFHFCYVSTNYISNWNACLTQCCPNMPQGNLTTPSYSLL